MIRFEEFDLGGSLGPGVAPFFHCDICGEKIVEHGNAVFLVDDAGRRTGAFLTVHKGCDTSQTQPLQWDDLDEFLYELWSNSKFDLSAVEQRRADGREFGLNS